ncbi:hypothetical protein GH5_06785 [Leishmania sp. Ghana 2012 LV757]|uniref:hypothetical protein n=1 Tax=Leishmania sp. Ghana 2012 LV757 TaxID=2803181 RepID=UPI001B5EC164|nr:hypothetical protein GH5_06785 [Leishmania sp. Ghana 2012 LV757]
MPSSVDFPRAHTSPAENHTEHSNLMGPDTASPTYHESDVPQLTPSRVIAPLYEGSATPRPLNCSGCCKEPHLSEADASCSPHPASPSTLSPLLTPNTPATQRPGRRSVSPPSQQQQLGPVLPLLSRRLWTQFPVRELPYIAQRDRSASAIAVEERAAAQPSMLDASNRGNAVDPPLSMLLGTTTRCSESSDADVRAASSPLSLTSTPVTRRVQVCARKESRDSQMPPALHISTPPLAFNPVSPASVDSDKRMWNVHRRQDDWMLTPTADRLVPSHRQLHPGGPYSIPIASLSPAPVQPQGAISPGESTGATSGLTVSRPTGCERDGRTRVLVHSPSMSGTATPLRNVGQLSPLVSANSPATSNEGWPHRYTGRSPTPHALSGTHHLTSSAESASAPKGLLTLDQDAVRAASEGPGSSAHFTQTSRQCSRHRYSPIPSPVYGDHIRNPATASAEPRLPRQPLNRQPHPWSSPNTGGRFGSPSLVSTAPRYVSRSHSSHMANRGGWSPFSAPLPTVMGIISCSELGRRVNDESVQSLSALPQSQQLQQPRASLPAFLSLRSRALTASSMHDHTSCLSPSLPELPPAAMEKSPERHENEEMLTGSPHSCASSLVVVEQQQQLLSTPLTDHPTERRTASTQEQGPLGHLVSLRNRRCRSVANRSILSGSSSRIAPRRCSYSSAPPAPAHSNVDSSTLTALTLPPPPPPPPPWSGDEALYWLRHRLTPQDKEDMLSCDVVYYYGPPVPPRTACGVTNRATPPPIAHHTVEETGSISSFSKSGEEIVSPTAPSSSSYFPITLGMHIGFRYEVLEVLGFGTFSVVVRAVDHAASHLSPERHCALKLIRRESLYQDAAQSEWAICDKLKECCASMRPWSESSFGQDTARATSGHRSKVSAHHYKSAASLPPASPWLSIMDQCTLRFASVLTPRSRFEYRGYHVIVFPLLGFSVRDVVELQRESRERKAEHAATASSSPLPANLPSAQAGDQAAATLPTEVVKSVLAQLVRALHFMHHYAHILHGDVKPENIVFVDRAAREGNSSINNHLLESSGAACPQSLQPPPPCIDDSGTLSSPLSTHPIRRLSFGFPSSSILDTPAPRPSLTHSGFVPCRPHTTEYVEKCCSAEVDIHESPSSNMSTSSSSLAWLTTPHPPPRNTEVAGGPDRGVTMTSCSHSLQHRSGEMTSSAQQYPSGGDLNQCTTSGPLVSLAGRSLCMTDSRTGVLTSSPLSMPKGLGFAGGLVRGGAAGTGLSEPPNRSSGSSRGASASFATASGHDSNGGDEASVTVTSSAYPRLAYALPYAMAASAATGTSSRVALIDLGHAHPILPGTTGTKFPLQSPSYRCPEMALRLPYTTAIDMWSVGCVLYELHTGRTLIPDACDDATMLQSAVRTLGMPDTAFLTTVKLCWRKYKQHKASTPEAAARAHGNAASPGTSPPKPQLALRQLQPQEPRPAVDGEDAEQDEEAIIVERCWRKLIHVLNNAAGRQREHERRLKHQQQSTTSPAMESSPRSPREAASPLANGCSGTTTWETTEQLALLQVMFPGGQVHESDQSFSLPSECDWHQYAWVDFLLGCLYWDAGERLTATEAQAHPYLAFNFAPDPTAATTVAAIIAGDAAVMEKIDALGDSAKSASGLPADSNGGVPVKVAAAIVRSTHCSGFHYLRRHPLTSRLLQLAPGAANQLGSPHGSHSTASEGAALLLEPLLMSPSAIVPFELPSSNRTAPSARMWEEHQHQYLRQEQQATHPQHLSLCYDSTLDIHSMLQTPAERLALSPCNTSHHPRNPFDDAESCPPHVIISGSGQGTESAVVVSAESSVRGNPASTQKPRTDGQTSEVMVLPLN